MNTRVTSVALVLISASAAVFAAEGQLGRQTEFVEHAGFVSTRTRADVRAELESAKASGRSVRETSEYVEHQHIASGRTHAEVHAEVEQAYADGSLRHSPEFVEHMHVASEKSRDDVRAEAVRAAQANHARLAEGGN